MGGVLGVTFRLEDASEFRMSMWTNESPWAIDNVRIPNKDPEHIKGIIDQWNEESTKPKPHWAYNEPFLAPSEYGLVVVDFLKNKILDCNHYHAFGFLNNINIVNEYRHFEKNLSRWREELKDLTEEQLIENIFSEGDDLKQLYEFFKEGRIKDIVSYYPEEETYKSVLKDGEKANELSLLEVFNRFVKPLVDYYNNRDDNDPPFYYFKLDLSPFELITFPESREGWISFRQTVLDLGFVLTEKEEEMWKERIDPKDEGDEGDEGDAPQPSQEDSFSEEDFINKDFLELGNDQ